MLFIVPVILIWIFSGINFVLRKVGNSITSYEEIKQNGDDWELNITSTFKNAHLKFKLGEEFDETTLDGRKCKVSNEKIKMHSSTLTCTSLWWNSYKTKLFFINSPFCACLHGLNMAVQTFLKHSSCCILVNVRSWGGGPGALSERDKTRGSGLQDHADSRGRRDYDNCEYHQILVPKIYNSEIYVLVSEGTLYR